MVQHPAVRWRDLRISKEFPLSELRKAAQGLIKIILVCYPPQADFLLLSFFIVLHSEMIFQKAFSDKNNSDFSPAVQK